MKRKDAYSLADIFREIELELVASFKRNMNRHKASEEKVGFTWEQWQKAALRDINRFRVDNRKMLKPNSSKVNDTISSVLNETYDSVARESIAHAQALGIEMPFGEHTSELDGVPFEEENFFKINDKKLNALISDMQTDFDPVEGLIIRKLDNEYRNVLDKVAVKMVAGLHTYQSATDEATKELMRKGLDIIQYKDGRRVNIATYAEMYLRTANQRATFIAGGQVRDRLGVFTVLMSQHANCSKMCLPFQGTVLIDDVYTSLTKEQAVQMSRETGYQRLSFAMEEFAFHPNCRHSLLTWFPGKSSRPKSFTDKQKDGALKAYDEEQKQRKLETEIRRLKRIEKGSLDPKNISESKSKIKVLQGELRKHIKENPDLRRSYWRERISEIEAESGDVKSISKPLLAYEDVTQEWLDKVDPSKVGKVTELDYFEIDGVRYDSSNSTLKFDFGFHEKLIANKISQKFTTEVKLIPRVTKPQKVRTPDYIIGEDYWDLKEIEGSGRFTISNRIYKGLGQANKFVIDLKDKSRLTLADADLQINDIFSYPKTDFVDTIMVLKGGEIIKIVQKKR